MPPLELTPSIRRFLVKETGYTRVLSLDRVRKFAIIADSDNTVDINIATSTLAPDEATNNDILHAGDARLWESTLSDETLSIGVYARVASGSATLIIWSWK